MTLRESMLFFLFKNRHDPEMRRKLKGAIKRERVLRTYREGL